MTMLPAKKNPGRWPGSAKIGGERGQQIGFSPSVFLALVAGCLGTVTAHGQGYAEGVSLSYEVLPLHTTGQLAPSFRADVWRASVVAPLDLAHDSTQQLLIGANAEVLRFGDGGAGFRVPPVYGLAPLLGYRRQVRSDLELTALLLPAVNSDLYQVRASDLRWGGVVRATYRHSTRLSYRATVGYRSQFFGPQYVLLLGIDWQAGGGWRLYGDLPSSFTISRQLGPHTAAGFTLTGLNTAYRLSGQQDQYLQYQQAHYGLFVERYLSAHWALRASGAYSLTRKVGVFAENERWPATVDYIGLGRAPLPLSDPLQKGFAFRVVLSYRVAQSQ